MNLTAPRCARCEGTRMLRVRRVMDSVMVLEGGQSTELSAWISRAVAFGHGDPPEPIGRFELLCCRRCGLTEWYAFDWQRATASRRPAPCASCEGPTPHATLPALERVDSDGSRPEPVRFTRGMLGKEGHLFIHLCEVCGHVAWRGHDYGHLENGPFKRFRVVEDRERPCLTCTATTAIIDKEAREYNETCVPVTVVNKPRLSFFTLRVSDESAEGHFELRLCHPCGALEWYARGIDGLKADPAQGLEEIGGALGTSAREGPYR